MEDISGFGLRVNIVASTTFPAGLSITSFADDADAFDQASMQIMDKAMGLNGDLITWSKAQPLTPVIAVIPNTEDDRNLSVLLESNRVGRGKISARDTITMTVIYPDGRTAIYSQGKITDGMSSNSIASSSRMKSKTYAFAFEQLVVAGGNNSLIGNTLGNLL